MNDKIKLAKAITSFVVGLGASRIAKTIISNNVEPESLIEKIEVMAGTFAIGGIVGKASREYTDATIDSAIRTYEKINAKLQEASKEAK